MAGDCYSIRRFADADGRLSLRHSATFNNRRDIARNSGSHSIFGTIANIQKRFRQRNTRVLDEKIVWNKCQQVSPVIDQNLNWLYPAKSSKTCEPEKSSPSDVG
jgi:hypothetical protein